MPFGGTNHAPTISRRGHDRRAFGGTTPLIDLAIQYKGQTLRQAVRHLDEKSARKAATDYAFHCIITDLGSGATRGKGQLIREGSPASSFHGLSGRLHDR